MANGWVYVLTVGATVVFAIYQYIKNREQTHYYENSHRNGGDDNDDDDDFIEINPSTKPNTTTIRNLPSAEEVCTICQDPLILKTASKKYCLVSLPVCGHWFHQRCALRLLEYHPMCPVCRIDIDRSMITNTVRFSQQAIDDCGDSSNDNNLSYKD